MQDWEVEFSNGSRISEFLSVLSENSLDIECRSALALLVLHSFTYSDPIGVTPEMAATARRVIHGDKEIYERMLSYWSDGFLEHEGWVQLILR